MGLQVVLKEKLGIRDMLILALDQDNIRISYSIRLQRGICS